MNFNREKVAERLGDLRKERGLSLAKLSKAVEEKTGVYISGTQLQKYENTERVVKGEVEEITDIMNVENAMALASFYNVSIDYLLGFSDTRYREHHDIAEETGLSEKAIIRLKGWTESVIVQGDHGLKYEVIKNTKTPEELNKIIESPSLRDLLDYIRCLKYIDSSDSKEGDTQEQIKSFPGPAKVKEFQDIIGPNNTRKYYVYLILDIFRGIINEVVPFTPVEDEVRRGTQADIDGFFG